MEWRTKVSKSLLLLLAIAIGARAGAELLGPLVPLLVSVLFVFGLVSWVLRRR